MTALSEHERAALDRARELGPALRRRTDDRVRLGGWLLAELVTIVERLDRGTGQDGSEEGKRGAQRPPAGELCGCRCKNPKGKCGCCDESLADWYASMEDGSDE